MIDHRGILSYLAITFGVTYAIEGALIFTGFRFTTAPSLIGQSILAGVMWVPAVAAVLTIKVIASERFSIANVRLGSWKPYLTSALVVPTCFTVTYVLTWLLGLAQPDWELNQFRALVGVGTMTNSGLPSSRVLIPALFAATVIIGPIVNGIFGFGEELGWRGYLLPKLMPLGKSRAYVLVGVIWGLWHAPLIIIGFNYPGYPILGILAMVGLTTGFSLYINELCLRHQSSLLAGWIHGAINGQAYGIWRILFPTVDPVLGGFTGLVGIAVWFVVGLATLYHGQATDHTSSGGDEL